MRKKEKNIEIVDQQNLDSAKLFYSSSLISDFLLNNFCLIYLLCLFYLSVSHLSELCLFLWPRLLIRKTYDCNIIIVLDGRTRKISQPNCMGKIGQDFWWEKLRFGTGFFSTTTVCVWFLRPRLLISKTLFPQHLFTQLLQLLLSVSSRSRDLFIGKSFWQHFFAQSIGAAGVVLDKYILCFGEIHFTIWTI